MIPNSSRSAIRAVAIALIILIAFNGVSIAQPASVRKHISFDEGWLFHPVLKNQLY